MYTKWQFFYRMMVQKIMRLSAHNAGLWGIKNYLMRGNVYGIAGHG